MQLEAKSQLKKENGLGSKQFWKKLKRQRVFHIILLFMVIWLVVFCYAPMYGLYMAFSDFNVAKPIISAPFVGFKYFKQFFDDPQLIPVLKNTLGISILNIVIGFPIPIIFALLLNEIGSTQFKRIIQTVSYLPHFVSWVILGGFLINWSSETGLINTILINAHLIKAPIFLVGDAKYFWGMAVGSGIWKEMGWGAILYIAAIAGIGPELYEAATIDGAGRFQKIINITLPSIKGTIAILFTFTIAGLLNSNFEQIFVLKNSLNASTSTVLDIYVYRIGMQLGRFSYSSAVGLLKSIFALALLYMANKVSDKLTGSSFM